MDENQNQGGNPPSEPSQPTGAEGGSGDMAGTPVSSATPEQKCVTCGNAASGGSCVACGQGEVTCTCTPQSGGGMPPSGGQPPQEGGAPAL